MNSATETVRPELAILAHELREPLSSILIAADIAKESTHEEVTRREMCEMIGRQARHVARIIDDVLDAARAFHGKLVLRRELFDIGVVVADAAEVTRPLFQSRQHRLKITLPPGKTTLMADNSRVKQILINLLTNAAKYTEPGGMILLAVESKGESLVIIVRDNGIGIPRDLLPRVFDMFQQGDAPIHRDHRGLGVGLALVKSLVDLHGGSISAHSHGERTGSTFVVRLPGVASPDGKENRFPYSGQAMQVNLAEA
jgi:signal transduction histidine kinase